MSKIVAKFGGSSLADSKQFEKVKNIIESDSNRIIIVPSAPGKRNTEDFKITDLLYLCVEHINHNLPFEELYKLIEERYKELVNNLKIDIDIDKILSDVKSEIIRTKDRDYAASRGEYINGRILAKYISYEFIDAKDIIIFDEDGLFNQEATDKKIQDALKKYSKIVVPGFYGATESGKIYTFSRGGSDFTGSIIAGAIDADLYENWTDVSGVMIADPRIVNNPKSIEKITYRELREMANMGANVLHEDAVLPIKDKNIDIVIKNTNKPEDKGTVITSNYDKKDSNMLITGIAGKKDFQVITMTKTKLQKEYGFNRRLFSVLEDLDIRIQSMPMDTDSVSLIIPSSEIERKKDKLVNLLNRQLNLEEIELNGNIALIGIIGEGMNRKVGISSKIFSALAASDVNIRMINQGASEINIVIGVAENDYEKAMNAIYNAFVNK